jgi:cation diffusion facilitator CzcD-associated flavoprotein CzcO
MRSAVGTTDAIVIGAGPAGLACAATMRAAGLEVSVLEKQDAVAPVWRRHYDCLHLHTERSFSGLPGMPMPKSYPRFPSRLQVVEYFEAYAAKFAIRPTYNTKVSRINRAGKDWVVEAGGQSLAAPVVVVATGWADFPYRPAWPGSDEYEGSIVHSAEYRNAAAYVGKRTLVVGYGNSGGEIALDLVRRDVDTTLSVRGPIQIMPRTIFGISTATLGVFQRRIPARAADLLNIPLLLVTTGRLETIGLQRAAKGPRRMVEEDGRSPIIDIGTLAKIRDGAIKLRGGIVHFTSDGVAFSDADAEKFDAVILATGFRPDLRQMAPESRDLFGPNGQPRVSGRTTKEPGLYFCGMITSPAGQLREIGIEARQIARLAKRYLDSTPESRPH